MKRKREKEGITTVYKVYCIHIQCNKKTREFLAFRFGIIQVPYQVQGTRTQSFN